MDSHDITSRGWCTVTGAQSLVLDGPAWNVVADALPDLTVPAAFRMAWGSWDRVAAGRAAAVTRLRGRGLLERDDRPIAPLAERLRVLSQPGLRLHARTWWGDRSVLSDLALGVGHGVGLVRLQRVHRGGTATDVTDAAAVEVLFFDAPDVVEQVWRVVPPAIQHSVTPRAATRTPPGGVAIGWPEGAALAAAVRRVHGGAGGGAGDGADGGAGAGGSGRAATATTATRIAGEVREELLGRLGLVDEPEVFGDLVTGLDGAVDLTVSAVERGPDGAMRPAAGARVWSGLWLLAGGRLVAVAVEARAGQPYMRFTDSHGAGLRTDLTRAVTDVLDRQSVQRPGPAEVPS